MVGRATPAVQIGPAVAEERGPVGLGWLRDLPDFRDYTSESAPIASQLETIGVARPQALSLAAQVDLRAVLLADREPGLSRLLHGERDRRPRRVLRAARARQVHRRVATLPLQGDARPPARDGRHGRLPALDDGSARAVRRSARGVLPVQRGRVRHRAQALCFAFAPNFRAIAYYRLDPAGTSPSALLDEDQGEPRRRPSVGVRLHRLQLDLAGGHDGHGSRIRARATR